MSAEMKNLLKKADAVCFDVDSTIIQQEGIDELASYCEKGEQVANLTAKAMTGGMTFQESLKLRLDIIQPSIKQVCRMKEKGFTFSPGAADLVKLLQERSVDVYLISGGFKCLILPIAAQLNIPDENVFANKLLFDYKGEYAGFDENSPTSKTGGKAVVIDYLKSKKNYKNLIHIGDGITDWEACPPADGFIGYGGNVIRPQVQAKAKWFVTKFQEIIDVLSE